MAIRAGLSRVQSLRSVTPRRRAGLMGIAVLLGAALLGAGGQARAQAYPTKPIKLIIPFTPGGSTDISARLIAEEMSKNIGQTVVVENKPGNAGAIGIDLVSKSAPDGYTIGISGSGPTLLLNLVGQPTGYTTKDLTMIGFANTVELVIVARPNFPANNAGELIAYAKANPGKLTEGYSGTAGVAHLSWEYFNSMANIKVVGVPYKGDSPILTDLMGGVLDTGIVSAASSAQMIKSGKLKALGLTGASSLKSLPGVPLVSQTGLPGYEAYTWNVLVGPAGMPPAVTAKLNESLNTALKSAALRDKFEDLGLVPGNGGTPQDANNFVAREHVKWDKIVKIPGIKLKD